MAYQAVQYHPLVFIGKLLSVSAVHASHSLGLIRANKTFVRHMSSAANLVNCDPTFTVPTPETNPLTGTAFTPEEMREFKLATISPFTTGGGEAK